MKVYEGNLYLESKNLEAEKQTLEQLKRLYWLMIRNKIYARTA